MADGTIVVVTDGTIVVVADGTIVVVADGTIAPTGRVGRDYLVPFSYSVFIDWNICLIICLFAPSNSDVRSAVMVRPLRE